MLGEGGQGSSSALATAPTSSIKRQRSFSGDDVLLQQTSWIERFSRQRSLPEAKQFIIFSAPPFTELAARLQASNPNRFRYFPIDFSKFADGTDNITISGYSPKNFIASSDVLFLASFDSNDTTLSQFSVFIVLLQSFISSLTICLPYFPVGTNERVEEEGKVATANTYSALLSNLPAIGKPTRLMIYDIHTLQNRFYFHSSILASLHTCIPLLLERLKLTNIRCAAFPDDGAAKRFQSLFRKEGFDIVVCGKVRDGDKRRVRVQDGEVSGKSVIVVDDLVQTGGTLYECGLVMRNLGASSVSAFVTHGVFPKKSWSQFLEHGSRGDVFDKFYVTNSIPSSTNDISVGNKFEVLDILPLVVQDLDSLTGIP